MRSGSPRTNSFNVSCRIPLPIPLFTGLLPWGRGWTGWDQVILEFCLPGVERVSLFPCLRQEVLLERI